MIKFSNLILKNFLSHTDTELNIADYKGLVLVEGQNTSGYYNSNGSGKSTLLEGIVYALTGDTLRGVGVNDVINRTAKKNTNVSLRFVRDNEEYLVSRYRKDESYGDSLVLYKGEENISKRLNKDTQKSLDDVLSISYKILSSTVLLGEGLSSRFTQLSDPEKKSLIESTLNLKYDISKIRDTAKDKLKEINLESSKVSGVISTLESLLSKDKDEILRDIDGKKESIGSLKLDYSKLEGDYKRISSELETISPKLTLLNNAINRINTIAGEMQVIQSQYSDYGTKKLQLLGEEVATCSLCHQLLSSEESKQNVINSYNEAMIALLDQLAEKKAELDGLPPLDTLKSKVRSLTEDHTNKSAEIRDITSMMNSTSVKITEATKDIEYLESTLLDMEDCSSRLEESRLEEKRLKAEADKYEYFNKLFSPSGIIINILSDAINYINTRLSVYSNVLLEKDYRIEFVKSKISLVDSKGSTYQSLSNGEKRRLDIAIQFSLHDYIHTYCGNSIDTMFIDEILDTLDDTGIENIITVLRLKLDYCKLSRIFIISHNSELKSYFDNSITVVKDEKGNSSVKF